MTPIGFLSQWSLETVPSLGLRANFWVDPLHQPFLFRYYFTSRWLGVCREPGIEGSCASARIGSGSCSDLPASPIPPLLTPPPKLTFQFAHCCALNIPRRSHHSFLFFPLDNLILLVHDMKLGAPARDYYAQVLQELVCANLSLLSRHALGIG